MSLEICRICLLRSDNTCSIYEPANEECTLHAILCKVCPAAFMDHEDGILEWHTKICGECKRKTLDANELYELCMVSGERFRNLVSSEQLACEQLACEQSTDHSFIEMVEEDFTEKPDSYMAAANMDDTQEMDVLENKRLVRNEECVDDSHSVCSAADKALALAKSLHHSCPFCEEMVFQTQADLTEHLKTLHSDKVHSCDPCARIFVDPATFESHVQCHALGRHFFCLLCEKGFRLRQVLKHHILSHNAEYLCSQCGKKFNDKSNLRQHVKRHSSEKRYACSLCPIRFHSKNDLKMHQSTHSTVKQFSCNLCSSKFNRQYSLVCHQRIHTGERPYSCEACKMSFYTPHHLKRHMLTHTGEKPFKCHYCDRKFAQSNDMVKHTRIHIGACIYQCNRCDASFRLLSELRNHYKDHYQQGNEETPGWTSAEEERHIRFTSTDILNLRYAKETSRWSTKRKVIAKATVCPATNGSD